MAIDSSLFMADIPAGTYTKGDTVTLTCEAGPSVVRSGRGTALLKRLTVGIIGNVSGSASYWKISVKNSDWIDEMTSLASTLRDATALDERSGGIQRGNDCPLTPNSSWEVVATCVSTGTTTVANTIFALIDIDYPQVSSITDPDALVGIPTSIEFTPSAAISYNALGTGSSSAWNVINSDIFKAGYEYALQKIEIWADSQVGGFVALANAAGMGGLQRIMPIASSPSNIRNKVEFATRLQKGPMDIKYLLFANSGTATTGSPELLLDFVKRRV